MKPSASLVQRGFVPQESPRWGSLMGLVWALLPRRRLSTPLFLLILGSVLLAPFSVWPPSAGDSSFLLRGTVQGLLLMVLLSSASVPASPSLSDRLLPLTVGQVFVMHVAQRLLLGVGPFVVVSLVVWSVRALTGSASWSLMSADTEGSVPGQTWLELAFLLFFACLVPFLAVRSPIVSHGEATVRRVRVIMVWTAWLLFGVQWLPGRWQLIVTSAAVLLALPWAWWQWQRASSPMPSAWWEPGEPTVGATTQMVARTGVPVRDVPIANHQPGTPKVPGREPGVRDVLWLVWTLSPTRKIVAILPFLYATLLGYSTFTGARASVSLAAALIPVMLMFTNTQGLSVLPVRPWRRLLLGVLMGPVLSTLGMMIGLGLRAAFEPPLKHTREAPYAEQLAGDWDNPSRVELAYWRWSEADAPPVVVAPWGEQVEPYAARVLGRWLYNPFTIRDKSSGAFRAWQWQRLTTAVYGQPVPQEQFSKRERQHPPMRSEQWPVLVLRTAFSFALMTFLVLPCWHMRIHRYTWRSAFWTAVFVVPMLLPMLASALVDGLRVGLVSAVADQLLLALVAGLPSDPISMATMLAILALLPALAALGLLYRASLQPMLEFSPRQTPGWGSFRG